MMQGYSAVRTLLNHSTIQTETELDWAKVRQEGLLGLVANQFIRDKQSVPQEYYLAFMQSVAFQMRCASELAELSQAAQKRGIQVLTFKGCALAFSTYPRMGQRAFGDIDLAVQPCDWQGMLEVLRDLGFSALTPPVFARDSIVVDLHRHPLHQLAELVGPRSQEWWNEIQPLSQATGSTFRLSTAHEFVLALLHGAKHAFSRAGWLVDIALLSQAPNIQEIANAVQRFRATHQLSYAARCLEAWFGFQLPSELSTLVRKKSNRLETRFVELVIQRRAPEILGMLTPVTSAPSICSAARYLRNSLYPAHIPRWKRTRQLIRMTESLGNTKVEG